MPNSSRVWNLTITQVSLPAATLHCYSATIIALTHCLWYLFLYAPHSILADIRGTIPNMYTPVSSMFGIARIGRIGPVRLEQKSEQLKEGKMERERESKKSNVKAIKRDSTQNASQCRSFISVFPVSSLQVCLSVLSLLFTLIYTTILPCSVVGCKSLLPNRRKHRLQDSFVSVHIHRNMEKEKKLGFLCPSQQGSFQSQTVFPVHAHKLSPRWKVHSRSVLSNPRNAVVFPVLSLPKEWNTLKEPLVLG